MKDELIGSLFLLAGIVGLTLGSFAIGDRYRADKIQTTCESDDQPTVINGTEYLCLSKQQLERIQKQQRQFWRHA